MIQRPSPRWVRIAGIITVLLCVLLLALGGFVTTFRVGMADPVWPTEPWFLLGQDWQQLEFGFLIEHTHRLAGWLTGLAITIFAFGAWSVEPNRKLRLIGLVTLVGLLVSYGEFHRGMGKAWSEIQEKAKSQQHLDPQQSDFSERLMESDVLKHVTKWPIPQGLGTAGFALGLILFGSVSASRRTIGGSLRFMVSLGLVFVMIQGLLGGFRVFLNALAGTNLAAIHGVFGQVTFAVLVAAMVLCQPRKDHDALSHAESAPLIRIAYYVLLALFLQLIWAVWVRHYGSPIAQRLHILTAFVATGLLVWLAVRILVSPYAKRLFRGIAIHLLIILAVQLLLGVESYLGKFVTTGPQAQVMPEDRIVTQQQAGMRTAHQLIGAGLLAAVAAAAIRLGRKPIGLATNPEKSQEIEALT